MTLISIIVPLPKFGPYIYEAIPYYEGLNFQDFELIIVPDEEQSEILSEKLAIRVIPSGKVGPAEKRDLGATHAKGRILAFTDDDAYPDPEWLSNVLACFADESVAAVGGPAITPPNDSFWQKVSGSVYESIMSSGYHRKRYIRVGQMHEDYDLPSVNLIVRRDIFEKVGGFDSTFYPGEDTKLCLEIKRLGLKILYHPDVLVYHHRRSFFPYHFKQIANYALHRGFFAKRYPETSRKFLYFLPSLFLIGLVGGLIFSLFSSSVAFPFVLILGIYFLLSVILNFRSNVPLFVCTVVGVFLSHLAYGYYFIRGLLVRDLQN